MLGALLALTWLLARLLTQRPRMQHGPAWDGGLRRLLPEMTYTATGFSNPVRVVFDAVFRPTTVEDTSESVAQHFRTAIQRQRSEVHLIDRLAIRPLREGALRLAALLARLHHGRLNAYLAYVLIALLAGLLLASRL